MAAGGPFDAESGRIGVAVAEVGKWLVFLEQQGIHLSDGTE